MKLTFTLLFSFLAIICFAQLPPAPHQMQLMGTNVTITSGGMEKIREKYQNLFVGGRPADDLVNRAKLYFPIIERELMEKGVPDDFKYLALQESKLQGNAISRSNAVGFWQFKDPTAREYSLRIDDWVDVRKNVVSSTQAAASYFAKSHTYLRNWVYSLLSFYTGLKGAGDWISVNQLSMTQVVIDENSHYYLHHFLANYFAFKSAYEQAKMMQQNVYLLEYSGGNNNTLKDIASYVQINIAQQPNGDFAAYEKQLMEYNPWLQADRIPLNDNQRCFSVVIPVQMNLKEVAIQKLKPYSCGGKTRSRNSHLFYTDSIPDAYPFIFENPDAKSDTKLYKAIIANGLKAVMVNDQLPLSGFLSAAGISQANFLRFNDLKKLKTLEPNQPYYLEEKPASIPVSKHIWKAGEDLWAISQKYGIKYQSLLDINELANEKSLKEGDFLWFNKAG